MANLFTASVTISFSIALFLSVNGILYPIQQIHSPLEHVFGSQTNNILPFCSRSEIRTGRWIKSHDKPLHEKGGGNCPNKNYNSSVVYDWKPDANCRLDKFDQATFCSLMKEAPILIVGDSLSFEHFSSLVSSLGGGTTSRSLNFHPRKRKFMPTLSACPHNRTFVMFRREDYPRRLDSFLKKKFPVVLILNRGAHYVEDDVFVRDLKILFQYVADWQQQCVEYGIQCHFFWRTTVPGNPECEKFTEPVNNISLMEEMVTKDATSLKYHWDKFKHQNELALDVLEASNVTNYHVIDAYHIVFLRPDQHVVGKKRVKDCVHSCLPGKVDVYNQLIQHVLMQTRTKQDVKQLEKFDFPWNRTTNVRTDNGKPLFLTDELHIFGRETIGT